MLIGSSTLTEACDQLHMLDNRLRIERQIFQGRFEFTGIGLGAFTQRIDGTSVASSIRTKPSRGESASSDPFDNASFDESATIPPPRGLDTAETTEDETTTDASEAAGPSRSKGLKLSSTEDGGEAAKGSKRRKRTKKRDIMLRLGLRGPLAPGDESPLPSSRGSSRNPAEKGRHIRASTEEPAGWASEEDNRLRQRDLRRRYSLGALRLAEPLWAHQGESRVNRRLDDEAAGSTDDDLEHSWEEPRENNEVAVDDDSESDSDPGRPGQWIQEGSGR